MPPAARLLDLHTCPLVDGLKPHVGGPVTGPGMPTVMILGSVAARMGDLCTCVSPAPDSIAKGSPTVYIGPQMAARMGDPTVHGGLVTTGAPTVMIGEMGMGSQSPSKSSQVKTMKMAKKIGAPFVFQCPFSKG